MTDLDVALTPAQWEHWDRHGWTLTAAPTTECRNTLHDLRDAPVSEYHCPECGRAPYRSKDNEWYCFDPKGESACRWRGPNPKVTPCCVPVPATVPCPGGWDLLQGPSNSPKRVHHDLSGKPCPTCSGSGVVPRTVGIIRPERVCPACGGMRDVAAADEPNPMPCARCKGLGHFPAERVGTATVTPVPVVDVNGPWPQNEGAQFVTVGDGLVMLYTADRDADEGYDGEDLSGYGPTDPPLFATPPAPGTTVWRLDRNEER